MTDITIGHGFLVFPEGSRSGMPLRFEVSHLENLKRKWNRTDNQGRTYSTLYYIERVAVRTTLRGGNGEVLWNADKASTAESDQSALAAVERSTKNASCLVARAMPYKRRPLNKKGLPFDPRVELE